MTKLAIAQMLMPIAKMLIEKLFDMLQNDSSTYDSSAKTSEDTDAFLQGVQDKLPQIKEIFKENGLDFKTSGDLDHSSDVQALIDKLEELKASTSSPADIAKLDSLINSLTSAKTELLSREASGSSTGENDFKIETPRLIPSSGILIADNNLTSTAPTNYS